MAEGPQVKLRADWLARELVGGGSPRVSATRRELRELSTALDGRRIEAVWARGNHILFTLEGDQVLWHGLGDRGRWRKQSPDSPPLHGTWLTFSLPQARLVNLHGEHFALLTRDRHDERLSTLGVDALQEPFPRTEIAAAVRGAATPLGVLLVDSKRVDGVGDTAKSEALFRARLDPRVDGADLDQAQAERLADALCEITRESYANAGRWSPLVYQRAGRACADCGSPVICLRQGEPPCDTFACASCQGLTDLRGEERFHVLDRTGAPERQPRARRSGRFAIGCAVWNFPGWVGSFYPEGAPPKARLSLYAQRLTAVEGNTTFYALPPAEAVDRWRAELPPGFRFVPKLARDVTHEGPLADGLDLTRLFIERLARLEDRMGPIFAQLPRHYTPQRIDDLERFVRAWPHARVPLLVELRHADWFREEVHARLCELLGSHGAGLALLDSRPIFSGADDPQRDSQRKKPRLPVLERAVSGHAMVRFIGHPDPARNERYFTPWAERVKLWLEERRDVSFFAHCPREEFSPSIARAFHERLVACGAPVDPLPWDSVVAPVSAPAPAPAQRSLFD